MCHSTVRLVGGKCRRCMHINSSNVFQDRLQQLSDPSKCHVFCNAQCVHCMRSGEWGRGRICVTMNLDM